MCKSTGKHNNNIKISNKNIKDYADSFSLRENYFWDSKAEEITYDVLKEELDEHYIALPHVAFTNVFDIKKDSEDIKYKLLACVSEYHFDFVIYNSAYFFPVLLIEINGGAHAKSSKRNIDTLKEKLLITTKGKETGLTLINIDILDQHPDDVLKDRIKKTLHYTISRLRYRAYCPNPECRAPLNYLQNGEDKTHFYLCPHCEDEVKKDSAKNLKFKFDEIKIPFLFKTKEL